MIAGRKAAQHKMVLRRSVLDTRERFTPRARLRVTALSRCEARMRRATAAGVGPRRDARCGAPRG